MMRSASLLLLALSEHEERTRKGKARAAWDTADRCIKAATTTRDFVDSSACNRVIPRITTVTNSAPHLSTMPHDCSV